MKRELPATGKVSPDIFDEIILPRLGRRRPQVLVGPRNGVDVGVVDLGNGRVMVTTTDPVFVIPAYGWERAAWFAVHILASDAATSGLPPAYITLDLNLPLSMDREAFEAFWNTVHRECDAIGLAVISGHTGRYQGCEFPMIGGATVICVGPKDRYLTPAMARPGDAVLVTKGAAVEAAGLFAATFPDRIEERFGSEFAEEARELFWQMSVVEDARIAVEAGVREEGVTSMHDATECGVLGGLYEVARAAGVGMTVEKEAIIVQDPVRRICGLFGIDPYTSISEGSLIVTCRPHRADEVLKRLGAGGIPASRVGEVTDDPGRLILREDGQERPLEHPRVDPFWGALAEFSGRRA
ncbi:MAG TPA: AIR synthase family protein [bacterium]|nr:AIR synthase family protein [bacterium]HPQ66465.1 AIR synthase family protein [bacterium]